jgi:hypothetical protein
MDWIDVAQDMEKWRTDVNTVMNIRLYKMQRISISFSRKTLFHGVFLHIKYDTFEHATYELYCNCMETVTCVG